MTQSLRARLHHLQLASPKPERLARFYGDALGMTVTRSGHAWICRGPSRYLIFVEGEAKSLGAAGYAVADCVILDGLCTRLSGRKVAFERLATAFFPEHAVTFRDPDGHRISYGVAADGELGPDQPKARLQHLVVGSTNAARMVEFYTTVVGLRESDRVDDGLDLRTSFMRTDDEHHSFAVFQTSENCLDHHCYEVPDWNAIRDWGDRFASKRIPIKWGPGRHGPGNNLFLFIHDPDGNWVEFSAELQIVSSDAPVGHWQHEERTLNSWGQAFLRS